MRFYLIFILFSIYIFANDNLLTSTKQQITNLKEKQIKEKEYSNKFDWLSDINLNSSISKDEDDIKTKDHSLSISQDIFKFGGISSQINYAKELKKMESLELDISTKDDLNTLFALLIDIKLNEINLEQNNLNILNSEITLRQTKSQYNAGESDISDLNDAIMTRNELQDTKKQIQLNKLININTLKKYTQKSYKDISIPNPDLMNKEIFLQNSSAIKYASSDIAVNDNLYKIQKSEYLPNLSLDASYGYNESDTTNGDNYYNYGVSVSFPLSFTASSNIEQTKIDYLISKQELNEQMNEISLTYDEAILTINNYKERIKLAKEDIKLYKELLETNLQEYKAGYKTIDDIDALKNSKKIRELDIETYKLNIQKEVISLYYQT